MQLAFHVCQWRIAIISLFQLRIDIPCTSILIGKFIFQSFIYKELHRTLPIRMEVQEWKNSYYITIPVAYRHSLHFHSYSFMFLQVMKTYMFCAAFVQVYFSIIHLQRAAQNIANQCICPVHLMTTALSFNNYISCKAGRSMYRKRPGVPRSHYSYLY